MERFLLTIEFRYKEIPKSELFSGSTTKTITLGVFDNFEAACNEGNKLMVNLENRFKLKVFPNGRGTAKRERFSKNGGCFGSKKSLITNLGYLKTPFDFYAKITTLKMDNIDEVLNNLIKSIKEYRNYKLNNI